MSEKQLSRKQKKLTARKDQRVAPDNSLKLREISPLTDNQRDAFGSFEDGMHMFLHGTAGTGKSFISLYLGLQAVYERQFHKVIIFRSAVPTRDMGFMPGNEKEKAKMYEAPYQSICTELYGRGDAYEILKHKDIIQFTTTSYVRGITLDNCVIVVDEMQNMSAHELDSIITRMGHNCRIIYAGDSQQSDFTKDLDKKGLVSFSKIIKRMHNSFKVIQFGHNDIVRGPTVKEYIIAKEALGADF